MSNIQSLSLEEALLRLVDALPVQWTSAERQEVTHFVDVGEYGLALETLAGIAMEESRELPGSARADMDALAERMGIAQGPVMSKLQGYLSTRNALTE